MTTPPTAETAPTPLLAAALTRWAAEEDGGYGLRAATRLLIEYNSGRLLDDPRVRAHITLTGDGDQARAVLDWIMLHAAIPGRLDHSSRPGGEVRGHACLLLCCALAAGTPLHDLPRMLGYFDGWNARHVMYALYFAAGGDERDAGRGWLAYCANAGLASRVNVGLLADMFGRHIVTHRRSGAVGELEGQISVTMAQTYLSRLLVPPSWGFLPGPDGSTWACTWSWEAADTCRVTVALTRSGVLVVGLRAEEGSWELTANAAHSSAAAERLLTLNDLMTLRDHLRYAGIPVGDL